MQQLRYLQVMQRHQQVCSFANRAGCTKWRSRLDSSEWRPREKDRFGRWPLCPVSTFGIRHDGMTTKVWRVVEEGVEPGLSLPRPHCPNNVWGNDPACVCCLCLCSRSLSRSPVDSEIMMV
ncbi:hypothetical protein J6590_044245 [Homalodisca vitripennis]|nr:hypothetical protein J6590_044245 [Homalodisca vitripennis]